MLVALEVLGGLLRRVCRHGLFERLLLGLESGNSGFSVSNLFLFLAARSGFRFLGSVRCLPR